MNFPQALFFQNDSVDLSIFCKEDIQALIDDVSSTVLNEVFEPFTPEPLSPEATATLQNFLKYFLFLKLFDFLFSEYNLKNFFKQKLVKLNTIWCKCKNTFILILKMELECLK